MTKLIEQVSAYNGPSARHAKRARRKAFKADDIDENMRLLEVCASLEALGPRAVRAVPALQTVLKKVSDEDAELVQRAIDAIRDH